MNSRDALVRYDCRVITVRQTHDLFKWAEGHDETVEVNQRALIDKVLARYSGEFTGVQNLPLHTDISR